MIQLTRLKGRGFILNAELIKFIEETPDTVVTLINNERLIIAENADEVVERVIEFQKRLRIFPRE